MPLLGLEPAAAGLEWPILAGAAVLGAWLLCAFVPERVMPLGRGWTAAALLGVAVLAAGYCAALWIWLVVVAKLDPTAHAYPAAVMVLHLWSGAFALVGIVMALFSAASVLAGRTDARHNADQVNTRLFWHYAFGFAAVSLLVTTLFPMLA